MPEKFPSGFLLEDRQIDAVVRFYHARVVVEVEATGFDAAKETLLRRRAYVIRDGA